MGHPVFENKDCFSILLLDLKYNMFRVLQEHAGIAYGVSDEHLGVSGMVWVGVSGRTGTLEALR